MLNYFMLQSNVRSDPPAASTDHPPKTAGAEGSAFPELKRKGNPPAEDE